LSRGFLRRAHAIMDTNAEVEATNPDIPAFEGSLSPSERQAVVYRILQFHDGWPIRWFDVELNDEGSPRAVEVEQD
jgi:hypothetical protein